MRFKLIVILMLLPIRALAQYTSVSATVLDPSGKPYANGAVSMAFVYPPNIPAGIPVTFTGTNQQIQPTSYGGQPLDSFAKFTFSLPDNNQISPSGSQWKFTVCAQNGFTCFNASITVTGTTQDISSQLQAAAAPLPGGGGGGSTNPGGTVGQLQFNNTVFGGSATLTTTGVNATIAATATANYTPLTAKCFAGGSNDCFTVFDNAGNKAFSVVSNGNLFFEGNSATYGAASQGAASHINMFGGASPNAGSYIAGTDSSGGHGTYLYFDPTAAGTVSLETGIISGSATAANRVCTPGNNLCASLSNPMTNQADIIVGGISVSGIAPPTRLGVGSVGQSLTVLNATTLGYLWPVVNPTVNGAALLPSTAIHVCPTCQFTSVSAALTSLNSTTGQIVELYDDNCLGPTYADIFNTDMVGPANVFVRLHLGRCQYPFATNIPSNPNNPEQVIGAGRGYIGGTTVGTTVVAGPSFPPNLGTPSAPTLATATGATCGQRNLASSGGNVWSLTSNVVTVNTAFATAPVVGGLVTISGAAVGGGGVNINGTVTVCGPSIGGCVTPTTTQFTFQKTASNDSSNTVQGTATPVVGAGTYFSEVSYGRTATGPWGPPSAESNSVTADGSTMCLTVTAPSSPPLGANDYGVFISTIPGTIINGNNVTGGSGSETYQTASPIASSTTITNATTTGDPPNGSDETGAIFILGSTGKGGSAVQFGMQIKDLSLDGFSGSTAENISSWSLTSNVVTVTTAAFPTQQIPFVSASGIYAGVGGNIVIAGAANGGGGANINGTQQVCGPPIAGCITPTSTQFTFELTHANDSSSTAQGTATEFGLAQVGIFDASGQEQTLASSIDFRDFNGTANLVVEGNNGVRGSANSGPWEYLTANDSLAACTTAWALIGGTTACNPTYGVFFDQVNSPRGLRSFTNTPNTGTQGTVGVEVKGPTGLFTGYSGGGNLGQGTMIDMLHNEGSAGSMNFAAECIQAQCDIRHVTSSSGTNIDVHLDSQSFGSVVTDVSPQKAKAAIQDDINGFTSVAGQRLSTYSVGSIVNQFVSSDDAGISVGSSVSSACTVSVNSTGITESGTTATLHANSIPACFADTNSFSISGTSVGGYNTGSPYTQTSHTSNTIVFTAAGGLGTSFGGSATNNTAGTTNSSSPLISLSGNYSHSNTQAAWTIGNVMGTGESPSTTLAILPPVTGGNANINTGAKLIQANAGGQALGLSTGAGTASLPGGLLSLLAGNSAFTATAGGSILMQPGTGSGASAGTDGNLEIQQPVTTQAATFSKGTLVCLNAVSGGINLFGACSHTSQRVWMGFAQTAATGASIHENLDTIGSTVSALFDTAAITQGDAVCYPATTDGLVTDNGSATPCTAGKGVGIVKGNIANSGGANASADIYITRY